MTARERLSFAFILSATLLVASCGGVSAFALAPARAQDQGQNPTQDADHLVEVARAYARDAQPATAQAAATASATSPDAKLAAASGPVDDEPEYEYKTQIMMDLVRKNYDSLDKEARVARSDKVRLRGGEWKLFVFYDAIGEPPAGDQAIDSDWNAQIDALRAWIAARPESAAARIALAQTYLNFGFHARGSGYADTVSETGWKLLSQRVAMAASVLSDAAALKEKCPYWFEAMQLVALNQGWDKSQAKELLDAAMAFDPTYYHYYREYANFLLPKWYGEDGDAQAFAEEISNKLGGDQGKFVYFEVASVVACECNSDNPDKIKSMSWPKIKEGYAVLGRRYGYSNLKANRFAYMAMVEKDKSTAQAAFAFIGENWEPKVWQTHLNFLNAKIWAESQQGE